MQLLPADRDYIFPALPSILRKVLIKSWSGWIPSGRCSAAASTVQTNVSLKVLWIFGLTLLAFVRISKILFLNRLLPVCRLKQGTGHAGQSCNSLPGGPGSSSLIKPNHSRDSPMVFTRGNATKTLQNLILLATLIMYMDSMWSIQHGVMQQCISFLLCVRGITVGIILCTT